MVCWIWLAFDLPLTAGNACFVCPLIVILGDCSAARGAGNFLISLSKKWMEKRSAGKSMRSTRSSTGHVIPSRHLLRMVRRLSPQRVGKRKCGDLTSFSFYWNIYKSRTSTFTTSIFTYKCLMLDYAGISFVQLTGYDTSSQVAEMRVVVPISRHIDMYIPGHCPIQPIPSLILKRQLDIQTQRQNHNASR